MSIGKIKEFDVISGTWSVYVDRVEMYFKANKIDDDTKLPTLIAVMGDEAYELLCNLASPHKPAELTYVKVVELLHQHLEPTPSVLAERYRFRQRRQNGDEKVAAYVADLKKLARHCKFKENLNENLRDQFVCGLRSDIIRQRLFAEADTISFTDAVKLASSLEAAERDAAAVESMATMGSRGDAAGSGGPEQAVHALFSGRDGGGAQPRAQREARTARGGPRGAAPAGRPRMAGATRQHAGGSGGTGGIKPDRKTNCAGCGATEHTHAVCRFRNYVCSNCRRPGHLRRVCPEREANALGGSSSQRSPMYFGEATASSHDIEVPSEQDFHHLCLNDYRAVSLPIYIDNFKIPMEVDTGTAISCISEETYRRFFRNHELETSDIILNFYDGTKIKPLGMFKPIVKYESYKKQLELFVIGGGTTSLLGRQWLTELKIKIPVFNNCYNIRCKNLNLTNDINGLLNRFKELFSGGLGRYTGGKATLRVRDGVRPVFHRARPVPYALLGRLDDALDAMLRDGIIEPVDCSDWASPLVPVNKPDGSLRICADYKATVNPVLLTDRYPLPRIEDIMVNLSGATYFSKIDLSQAYNQIELDDTKEYTVINTHRGLYRYNRLVYGLSSSPGIFQRIMCNLLKGIPNVEIFLDDVIIGGRNKREHLQALEEVFSRLRQSGLKLKKEKCVFLVKEVKYLGYIINQEGIKTDPAKVEAIVKIPRPANVSELRSFLGIINFYGKFVKNMSSRLVPLYELLKKGKQWGWTTECEKSFIEIKNVLAGTEVLAHYEPDKPLILTCDASARGIGGVLSQPGGGGERPVAYASRTLTDAEKNYSQIHREALAIIFCVSKFHQYLYGRNFTLRTDHKPLVSIFGPHTGIPTMIASRMQRWAIILSAYTFTIEYVRTDHNGADGFSRLPLTSKQTIATGQPEQTHLHFVQQSLLLDYNDIKRKTGRDIELSKILSYLRDGWPNECELQNLKPYFNRKTELYEELGCVMWGHRLVVPQACRDRVLSMLHEPHMGIVKSKSLARSYVWWPGVDEAVEHMCRRCGVCAAQADAPPQQSPRMWAWPSRPWSRIHIDYLGPISGRTYLVVVDATSKWLEVFNVSSTTAFSLINRLADLFSRWGLPKQIVSDNGTQFTSREFQDFTKANGIEHIFTAPYHPSSNGLAENAVRLVKRVIKKAILEKQNIDRAIWTFLMYYRNVEHSTTGESPATIFLGRRLRTKLDIIKPDRQNKVLLAQQRQVEAVGGAHRSIGGEGTDIWYRQFLKGERWVPGQIVECLGPSNYRVKGQSGETVHRHIDQLRRRTGGRPSMVSSGPSTIERSDTDSQGSAAKDTSGSGKPPQLDGSPERESSELPAAPTQSLNDTAIDTQAATEAPVALPQVILSPQRALRQCRLKNINYKV